MELAERILAIDPGGTTGLAWQMPDGSFMTEAVKEAEELWELLNPSLIQRVVYEQFGGRIISEHGLHTVRLIGGIQALCYYHKLPVQGRPPQSRKAFVDKAQDYIKQTKGIRFVVHEVDALSHLMSYLWKPELNPNRKTTARSYTRTRA
jgi:hypothetical protein